MALRHFEHFDLYGTSTAALVLVSGVSFVVGAGGTLTTTTARTGSHCYEVGNGARSQMRFTLSDNPTILGQGAAFYAASAPSGNQGGGGLRFITAAGDILKILPNNLGGITAYLNATTIASSAAGLFSVASWFWIEAKAATGAGTGTLEVRLNGNDTPVLSLTGLALPGSFVGATIGMEASAGQGTARFDDWVVWDTEGDDIFDFMGDTFIIVGPPEADTAVADWDASTGTSRFAMIDESVPSDTDYIQSDALGEACEFTHPAFNLGVGSIAAIGSQTRAFKSDAGAASYATGIASGGAASMSDEIALATGPNVHRHLSPRNPNGNVPWTQAAANAARLRVERNA